MSEAVEFRLPSLGPDMEDGTVLAWRASPGDRVKRGDVLVVIDTDKAALDVEAPFDATVERLLVLPGAKVPVGTVLATLGHAKASTAPVDSAIQAPNASARVGPPPATSEPPLAGPPPQAIVTAPPPSTEAGAAPDASARRARLRSAIAAAMSRANREIPHYYLATTLDAEPLVGFLDATNKNRPAAKRVLVTAVLAKATALAFADVPELNGFFRGERFEQAAKVHLGVAIHLREGGVVVPALHDAAQLSLDSLMATLRDVTARARSGSLRASEFVDATATVTSLADGGPEELFGVIFPPQVALVGFGAIVRRPWCVGESVVPRRLVHVSLAADHRATDGHVGARFLDALATRLAAPEAL